MTKQILTIENWRSEYQRLQIRYKLTSDKSSLIALGLLDHMQAVSSIMNDLLNTSHAHNEKAINCKAY
jgi:hypothetical protein